MGLRSELNQCTCKFSKSRGLALLMDIRTLSIFVFILCLSTEMSLSFKHSMLERLQARNTRFWNQRTDDDDGMSDQGRPAIDDDSPILPTLKASWQRVNKALIAGIFIAGIGAGITIDSAINTNPKDLASRDSIDKNAPNPKLCAKYGSSAMVFDQRVFVTFNPFNVYVSQADTKPGCVLRASNVVAQLQRERNLLSDAQVNACKDSFNTWAYVGDINDKPQLSCVYQSEDAQNEFLSNPKVGLGEDVYDEPRRPSRQDAAKKQTTADKKHSSFTVNKR